MTITKYLHSCLLIEQENKRILIDPGEFTFIEKKFRPEDIPPVDIVLITHEHRDHFYPDALKVIANTKQPRFITNKKVAALLKNQGFEATVIAAGETVTIGSCTIKGIAAPHGPLPVIPPENIGFLINGAIFHPGDSLTFELSEPPQVFLLPFVAPWCILRDSINTALKLKAPTTIPIHDAFMKDFLLKGLYNVAGEQLKKAGIEFKPLALGEKFELPTDQ